MRLLYIGRILLSCVAGLALLISTASAQSKSCPNDNTGLKLPAGFCATVLRTALGTPGTGKADMIQRFGETIQTGGAGGTGIGLL